MDYYIHGHGVYQPARGFTQVPPNFKISFYTEFAKQMSWSTVSAIINDPGEHRILRTVEEHKMVPNMVYVAPGGGDVYRANRENQRAKRLRLLTFPNNLTLSQIFDIALGRMDRDIRSANIKAMMKADAEGRQQPDKKGAHLHWLCCQTSSGLRDTGGGRLGFNATDRRDQLHPHYEKTRIDPVRGRVGIGETMPIDT